MERPASIPPHIWVSLSDEARAIVGAVIDGLERQVAELRWQVQDLRAGLDENSTNSSGRRQPTRSASSGGRLRRHRRSIGAARRAIPGG